MRVICITSFQVKGKLIVMGQDHWLYFGEILSHHIRFNKLNEEWRSQDFHVLISTIDRTNWKFAYLNPIHYCSTLIGKMPCFISANCLSIVLTQQFCRFVSFVLFTYISFINNWGNDTEKQTRNIIYSIPEIFQKSIQSQLESKLKKELSMADLPGWNADSKSTDLPQNSALSARSTLYFLGIMILP